MRTRTTADIVARFHRAFADHDAGLLAGLIGEECVMEAISPVPDGARTEGRDACLTFWRALAEDRTTQFEAEEVDVSGERATIRWRYRFGATASESVRGVTLMRVVGGVIVEALGYSKTGEVPLAAETEGGRSEDHTAGTRTVREVLDRYNEAFEERDPGLLTDLIADDCVIEDSGPAPDGARHVGGAACRARWTGLIEDPSLTFAPDSPEIFGDLAIQPWTLRWGSAEDERLRGVNLLRIREGKIVEARGYVKS